MAKIQKNIKRELKGNYFTINLRFSNNEALDLIKNKFNYVIINAINTIKFEIKRASIDDNFKIISFSKSKAIITLGSKYFENIQEGKYTMEIESEDLIILNKIL